MQSYEISERKAKRKFLFLLFRAKGKFGEAKVTKK